MENIGVWKYIMARPGEKAYTMDEFEVMITHNSLDPSVRIKLLNTIQDVEQMVVGIVRVAPVRAGLRVFFEPVNERLFEAQFFHPNLVDEEDIDEEFRYVQYIGMDVYIRHATGLLYGVGAVEPRVDQRALSFMSRDMSVVRFTH